MSKITPNPPARPNAANIDFRIADRALSHYNLGPEAGSTLNPPPKPPPEATPPCHCLSEKQEETLVDIDSILQSAAATAYENADNQTGPNRKVAMGVAHLIELAQLKMETILSE